MRKMLIIGCFLLLVGGCVTSIDPETGAKGVSVDPNVAAQIEGGSAAAVGILTVLGSMWPILIPIATGIGGVMGALRTSKPKLVAAQSEASMYYSATEAIVNAIEGFKDVCPDEWKKLEQSLAKSIGPKAENLIRALRGLPPKE